MVRPLNLYMDQWVPDQEEKFRWLLIAIWKQKRCRRWQ